MCTFVSYFLCSTAYDKTRLDCRSNSARANLCICLSISLLYSGILIGKLTRSHTIPRSPINSLAHRGMSEWIPITCKDTSYFYLAAFTEAKNRSGTVRIRNRNSKTSSLFLVYLFANDCQRGKCARFTFHKTYTGNVYRVGLAHSFYVCFYFSFFSVYFCTIYIFIIIIITRVRGSWRQNNMRYSFCKISIYTSWTHLSRTKNIWNATRRLHTLYIYCSDEGLKRQRSCLSRCWVLGICS